MLIMAMLLLCACNHQTLDEPRFLRARAVMDSCPECALAILDSIHTTDLQPGLDSARYILLHALAENKVHNLNTPDSLIRSIIPVLKSLGTTNDLRNAYYILGTSLDNQERYSEAIGYFMDAENLIDASTPPYEGGLIYNGLADCCNSTLNGELALKYITLAFQNFNKASKPVHAAYALYGKATYLTNIGNYNEAIAVFTKAKTMADCLNDAELAYGITSGLGYVYLAKGDNETALNYFRKLPKNLQMTDPQTIALISGAEISRGTEVRQIRWHAFFWKWVITDGYMPLIPIKPIQKK